MQNQVHWRDRRETCRNRDPRNAPRQSKIRNGHPCDIPMANPAIATAKLAHRRGTPGQAVESPQNKIHAGKPDDMGPQID